MKKEEKTTLESIKKAAEYLFRNHSSGTDTLVCRVTEKEGWFYGDIGIIKTGVKGILNAIDKESLYMWVVYYNGVQLTDKGKEEFYKYLEDYYVKES